MHTFAGTPKADACITVCNAMRHPLKRQPKSVEPVFAAL